MPSALKAMMVFFILGKFYDFQEENCVDQQRGFLKGFEADTDAEQGSEKG